MSSLNYLITIFSLALFSLVLLVKQNNSSIFDPLLTPAVALPAKTAVPITANDTLQEFLYPGSEKKVNFDSNLILESYDNPFVITGWYQKRIKLFDFKIISSIQTTTNGNVLNKIVGNSYKKEIQIEIFKTANNPVTKISLKLKFNE